LDHTSIRGGGSIDICYATGVGACNGTGGDGGGKTAQCNTVPPSLTTTVTSQTTCDSVVRF